MKKDLEIKHLVYSLRDKCNEYLLYLEHFNECAFSDRILEDIISKSKKIDKLHYARFEQQVVNKLNKCKVR